jgi:hypothetical protein
MLGVLGGELRYCGPINLSHEQLLNSKIIGLNASGQILPSLNITESENMTILESGNAASAFVTYTENVEVSIGEENVILATPGLYLSGIIYQNILFNGFSSLIFEHDFNVETKKTLLKKEKLPEYLQFGNVENERLVVVDKEPVSLDGDILYWDENKLTQVGFIAGTINECKVADYIDIPANTEIIATIIDEYYANPEELVVNGVLSEDKSAITIPFHGHQRDIVKIRENGIYLLDYDNNFGA